MVALILAAAAILGALTALGFAIGAIMDRAADPFEPRPAPDAEIAPLRPRDPAMSAPIAQEDTEPLVTLAELDPVGAEFWNELARVADARRLEAAGPDAADAARRVARAARKAARRAARKAAPPKVKAPREPRRAPPRAAGVCPTCRGRRARCARCGGATGPRHP